MLLLIKYTLLYGIVLMLVALGGMFSEHSGIINIALEGIMVIGGVAGVLTLTMLPADMSPFLVVLLTILAAALAGMVYSLLLAFASINLKADQTIGGTALNLLATAIAVVIAKYFSDSGSAKLNYSNKPFLFSIGGLELSVFVPLGIILLIISYVVLYKTRFGLRLRACGEHPQAADSVGINVYKMRYAGVLLSGALGAIGGMAYIVPPVQTWNFEVGVAAALVQQHLQHDAVRGVHGHPGLHVQEQHGPQGRGHPLRQGFPLIRGVSPQTSQAQLLFRAAAPFCLKMGKSYRKNLAFDWNFAILRLQCHTISTGA